LLAGEITRPVHSFVGINLRIAASKINSKARQFQGHIRLCEVARVSGARQMNGYCSQALLAEEVAYFCLMLRGPFFV